MTTKAELRTHFRKARAALKPERRAHAQRQLLARLTRLLEPTTHTMIYVGIRHELGTHGIIEALMERDQPLAVPRVEGDAMIAARLSGMEALTPGAFGVPTSAGEPLTPLELCITPGVAFTQNGERLGQGGGYYDRFFAKHPNVWRIGIAYDEQIATSLPVEAHDQKMHTVLTPTRLWGLTQRP